MELKLVGEDVERKQVEPLIEPYGIEIDWRARLEQDESALYRTLWN